jgi:hypothetical protein
MKKITLLAVAVWAGFSLSYAGSLQDQLREMLGKLAVEEDFQKRAGIQDEIQRLKSEINASSQARQGSSQPGNPSNFLDQSSNPNLHRDTYYYRGPVQNPNYRGPFLAQSFERGYGSDTHLLEGRPVYSLNNPNAYINEVRSQGRPLQRNPYTNPFQQPRGRRYENPGSQFRPPPFGFPGGFGQLSGQWGFPGGGFGRPGGQWGFPGGGYGRPSGQWGFPGSGIGYPGAGYGNNRPYDPVQQNFQAMRLAEFDATQRFRRELDLDPTQVGADQLTVRVVARNRMSDGKLQLTVQTSGGFTGQGRGQNRYYIYSSAGAFLQAVEIPLAGGGTGAATQIYRYRVTNEQRFEIDRYLAERGYNRYGDPLGTVYAGGSPLPLVQNGGTDQTGLRFNYILSKHPSLVQLFRIQPDQGNQSQP